MSYPLIRAQVATVLATVDGMGVIHAYQRWAADFQKFLTFFKAAGKINGCVITRTALAREQRTAGEKELAHVMTIRFYYGLRDDDASEHVLQQLLDDAGAAFDAKETLNDTCDTIHPDWGPMDGAAGLVVDVIEPRMFGNVLCNFAEARLCALETLQL